MQQYIVRANDSLFFIAKQLGLPLVQLMGANPEISAQNPIFVGQIIRVLQLKPIPSQLDIIESNAEDIIDDIYATEWGKAESKVNVIKINMVELIPLLLEALVPNELIFEMDIAIRNLEQSVMQRKITETITQTNHINKYIPDILDYFQVIIPTDVNRLDYLGRQIIIDVKSDNWTEVNNNYLTAKKIWERLKPQLNTTYSKYIAEFDQVINNLGESINNQIYQNTVNNANILIDRIDGLKIDFKQQNDLK